MGEVRIGLPGELRNEVVRIAIEGEDSAGAVMLVDESFRRRPVGIVSGDAAQVDQPLLGNAFYLARRSEEQTSELQSLMRISYAVSGLKQKKTQTNTQDI